MGCRKSHMNQELALGKTWVQAELGHSHENAKTFPRPGFLPVFPSFPYFSFTVTSSACAWYRTHGFCALGKCSTTELHHWSQGHSPGIFELTILPLHFLQHWPADMCHHRDHDKSLFSGLLCPHIFLAVRTSAWRLLTCLPCLLGT